MQQDMKRAVWFPLVAIVTATSAARIGVAANEPLLDKTLVVWASPANLTQRGGTALVLCQSRCCHHARGLRPPGGCAEACQSDSPGGRSRRAFDEIVAAGLAKGGHLSYE